MIRKLRPKFVLRTGIGVLVIIQGIALWLGAIAHTGIEVSVGGLLISEPQIIPAIIVEGVCGFLLIRSAYALYKRKPWTWEAIIIAQTIALGGVLLGITAIALGAGPHTPANAIFHRVMVVLLAGGLVLGFTPTVRESINQAVDTSGKTKELGTDDQLSSNPRI